MEHAPLRDRVSRELLRSVNEMGHALRSPRGVRQRCRKLAARLGCRLVGLDDEEEEDEGFIAPDAEEIGMSQLPGAPHAS